MTSTILASFKTVEAAQAAINDLTNAGFASDDIGLATYNADDVVYNEDMEDVEAGEGAGFGATVGSVVGAVAGLVAITVPGIGPVIAAGPLAAALGAITGAGIGAVSGAVTTVERAEMYLAPGRRSAALTLQLEIASSIGGDYPLQLQEAGELTRLVVNGAELSQARGEDRLLLPLAPGTNRVEIGWELPRGAALATVVGRASVSRCWSSVDSPARPANENVAGTRCAVYRETR